MREDEYTLLVTIGTCQIKTEGSSSCDLPVINLTVSVLGNPKSNLLTFKLEELPKASSRVKFIRI